MSALLQTMKLGVSVAGRDLVVDLDWQIQAGQCWCVIGRNGAGKTTLLRTLAGMRELECGQLQVQGRDLANWPLSELARQRAFLSQGI